MASTSTSPLPRIGLTVSWEAPPTDVADRARLDKYLAVVRAAGAEIEPLYLDEWEGRTREIATQFDGLLLAGGADLPPAWYGQTEDPQAGLDMVTERRPFLEKAAVELFLEREKPVLGICYGCQFLNVVRGGDLVQDIGLLWPEPMEHRHGVIHPVSVLPGTQLAAITGQIGFDVPSFHHQAVGRLAPGAVVSAVAPDSVVEAIEWEGSYCLGVQWHPERAPESEATRRLMAHFVQQCQK